MTYRLVHVASLWKLLVTTRTGREEAQVIFFSCSINTVISILFYRRTFICCSTFIRQANMYFSLTRQPETGNAVCGKKKYCSRLCKINTTEIVLFDVEHQPHCVFIRIAEEIRSHRINATGNNTVLSCLTWLSGVKLLLPSIQDHWPFPSNRYRIPANQSTRKVIGSSVQRKGKRNRAKRACENNWRGTTATKKTGVNAAK